MGIICTHILTLFNFIEIPNKLNNDLILVFEYHHEEYDGEVEASAYWAKLL